MLLSQHREMPQLQQLGFRASDDDETCDVSNLGVYQYVEVKEHCMLLSQRRYKSQLLQVLLSQRREMPQLHLTEGKSASIISSNNSTYHFKDKKEARSYAIGGR